MDLNMPDRCVVVGCFNVPSLEKGIALHKIPFFGDDRNKAKARRKKRTEFVQLKRAKGSPSASSAVLLLSLRSRRFYKKTCFRCSEMAKNSCQGWNGIVPVTRFHRKTFEQEELSDRGRSQVSLYLCCIQLIIIMWDACFFLLSFLQPRHILLPSISIRSLWEM